MALPLSLHSFIDMKSLLRLRKVESVVKMHLDGLMMISLKTRAQLRKRQLINTINVQLPIMPQRLDNTLEKLEVRKDRLKISNETVKDFKRLPLL